MLAAKPILEGQKLLRTYGDGPERVTALREVSIGLQKGQLVLLMGPNGGGKSTLLSVLSGLLRPDRGAVLVDGTDFWALDEQDQEEYRRRHFGFVFQGFNLFSSLTAREQLELVARWGDGVPATKARQQADDMLALLGLKGKEHLRPSQLSGGQKQRVAVGRALIKNPSLVFADEPTSALDWTHGQGVMKLLRDAATERGAAVLVVAHDARLKSYADRVYHLADGILTDDLSPEPGVAGERVCDLCKTERALAASAGAGGIR